MNINLNAMKIQRIETGQVTERERNKRIITMMIMMIVKFGLQKCETVQIVRGQLRTENFSTENDNEMTAISQGDTYKYLGT